MSVISNFSPSRRGGGGINFADAKSNRSSLPWINSRSSIRLNKPLEISGTALVLDEIINHVQSLQRQVEAYTAELESLVTQLEEENAKLLREEAEHNKERFKQLMKNLVPVEEKPIRPRPLQRMKSV